MHPHHDVLGLACKHIEDGASIICLSAFQLYYWDQAIGYLVFPLLAGLTFGSFGNEGRTLFADLMQADASSFAWAIFGGFVFNLANFLFVSAIDVAGMAVAFPIGIGIALVEGVMINYIDEPSGSPVLIFAGVSLITLAIVLDALAYRTHSSDGRKQGDLAKGVTLALVGGILMGLFYYLVQRSLRFQPTITSLTRESSDRMPECWSLRPVPLSLI